MRIRYNKNADDELAKCSKYIKDKDKLKSILENSNSVNVEIGMGKGQFIAKMAYTNPEKTYIGIEVCRSVLALAVKKISRFEEEKNIKLDNLYITSFDAINMTDFFNDNQIDTIYLNFSDPWPKHKHRKRRLTHEMFLNEYKKVIKKGGEIRLKTDNIKLFESSLISMNKFGLEFKEVYLDLHKTDVDNVLTEYEEKFCDKGPIYMLVCKVNK